jgi:hypothetical protein
MWLHRAYRNLRALGHLTDTTPGWAVGYWFIPFVCLVRPYNVVKELWEKSDAQGYNSSSIVGWWWATCLVSSLIGLAATTPIVSLVFDALLIAAACAAIKIINTIDDMQESRVEPYQKKKMVQLRPSYSIIYQ